MAKSIEELNQAIEGIEKELREMELRVDTAFVIKGRFTNPILMGIVTMGNLASQLIKLYNMRTKLELKK